VKHLVNFLIKQPLFHIQLTISYCHLFAIVTCSNVSLITYLNAFKPVTVPEVQRIIAKILVKTSPLDCVPIILVKSCSDVFSVLLAHLTNLSFAEGVFPNRFKLGQVTPILKKQGLAVDDPGSYRPISN